MEIIDVEDRMNPQREQLRAQGLRPIQIRVPDVRALGFKEEAKRQAEIIAEADRLDDAMDFIEATLDFGDED